MNDKKMQIADRFSNLLCLNKINITMRADAMSFTQERML